MNNSIKMIFLIRKFVFAKIKHLQNKKISSKFEGKSECRHYTHVKHYVPSTFFCIVNYRSFWDDDIIN